MLAGTIFVVFLQPSCPDAGERQFWHFLSTLLAPLALLSHSPVDPPPNMPAGTPLSKAAPALLYSAGRLGQEQCPPQSDYRSTTPGRHPQPEPIFLQSNSCHGGGNDSTYQQVYCRWSQSSASPTNMPSAVMAKSQQEGACSPHSRHHWNVWFSLTPQCLLHKATTFKTKRLSWPNT